MSEQDVNLTREQAVKKRDSDFAEVRKYWRAIIDKFSNKLKSDDSKTIIPLEAELLSRREELVEDIARIGSGVHKDNIKIKLIKEERLKYHIEKQQFKVTSTERKILIDSDMAYYEGLVELSTTHIQFLIDTKATVDHFVWGIKNKIALFKEIGMI